MKDNFERAIEFVLSWEKHLSNIPNDPGGQTVWGVCKRYYPEEVKKMLLMDYADSREYAKRFYKSFFWDVISGDDLPNRLDIVLFDCAVNQGVSVVPKIKRLAEDWKDAIIIRFRLYSSSPGWKNFSRGWSRRLLALYDYITGGMNTL